MKIIHTRATPEPILLLSACPCMNLFALVTRTTVTVYRSTTLTIVAVCALRARNAQAEAALGHVCAAWSPSGRLLSLALPDGTLWLLDVEAGELVQHLVPRVLLRRMAAMNASLRAGKDAGGDYGTLTSAQVGRLGALYSLSVRDGKAGQHAAHAHEGISSSSSDEDEDESDEEDENEENEEEDAAAGAIARDAEADAMAAMTPVPLSTSEAPVAAMTWALLRTSAALSSAYQSVCLPLAAQRTTPLLDELIASQANNNTNSASSEGKAACVATLWVLDVRGGLSVVLGGLREVCFFACSLPFSLEPTSPHAASAGVVRRLCVIESTEAQRSTSGSNSSAAQRIASYAFARFTRRALSREPALCHTLYLVCAAPSRTSASEEQLYKIDLGHELSPLLEPHVIANVCVAEYTRMAEACAAAVRQRWAHCLRRLVRQPLQLPHTAALLHDAVVEQIAMPAEEENEADNEEERKQRSELRAYYSGLSLDKLSKANERLRRRLRRLARRVYLVSYRCYDTALCLVQQSGQRRHDWLTAHEEAENTKHRTTNRSTYHTSTSSASDTIGVHSASQDTEALLTACIAQRRHACACEMQRMQVEAQHEGELVTWVLQRAGLLRTLWAAHGSSSGGGGKEEEEDERTGVSSGAAATMEAAQYIPLATERQPTLLHTLRCIAEGRSTSFACDDEDDDEAVVEQLRRVLQEHTCQTVTHALRLTAVDTRGNEGRAKPQPGVTQRVPCIVDLHLAPTGSIACTLETPAATTSTTLYLTSLDSHDKEGGGNKPCTSFTLPPLCDETAVWQVAAYGPLSASRHLLLYTNTASGGEAGDTLRLVLHDTAENDDDEEEEEASGTEEGSNAAQMVEVKGLALRGPHSVQLSISAAREFCVVAVHDKLMVIDLYEE